MSRPLRIEFAGATHHITPRGDRREDIFADDADAEQFLTIVAQKRERFDCRAQAYCLMSNHCPLVAATEAPTLSVLADAANQWRRGGQRGQLSQRTRDWSALTSRERFVL